MNEMLEAVAKKLTWAARYERNEARQGYRSGHYERKLMTTSGDVTLQMLRLKGVCFEMAIIERYLRRKSSVEKALIEMYLAGVSVCRVEYYRGSVRQQGFFFRHQRTEQESLCSYRRLANRPVQGGKYPYVYVDGIYLRRN